jgi:hypothetical protein
MGETMTAQGRERQLLNPEEGWPARATRPIADTRATAPKENAKVAKTNESRRVACMGWGIADALWSDDLD